MKFKRKLHTQLEEERNVMHTVHIALREKKVQSCKLSRRSRENFSSEKASGSTSKR